MDNVIRKQFENVKSFYKYYDIPNEKILEVIPKDFSEEDKNEIKKMFGLIKEEDYINNYIRIRRCLDAISFELNLMKSEEKELKDFVYSMNYYVNSRLHARENNK